MVQHTLLIMDHKIVYYFKQFTALLEYQFVILKNHSMKIQRIAFPNTAGNNHTSKLKWFNNSKIEVEFIGSCLKQNKKTLSHGNVLNLFIVYELNSKLTLSNCLFGAINLIKNADLDKYGYSGYDNGFHSCSQFLLPNDKLSKNVVVFGVGNNSSSMHTDNRKKILIFGQGPTDK